MFSSIIGGLVASAVPSAFFYWLGRRTARGDMAKATSRAKIAGYAQGREAGYEIGRAAGYETGKLDGLREGDNAGYARGFDRGKAEAGRKECRIQTEAHAKGQRAGVHDGLISALATMTKAMNERIAAPTPIEDIPF